MDLAQFENKGDSAMTMGEFIMLKKLNLKIIGYCFLTRCGPKSFKAMKNFLRSFSKKLQVLSAKKCSQSGQRKFQSEFSIFFQKSSKKYLCLVP